MTERFPSGRILPSVWRFQVQRGAATGIELDERTTYLLLDEYFAAGDDRFLDLLRTVHFPKKLAAVVERWKKDSRPWAHRQIIGYLDTPLNQPGHEVVVKRLFKHAESTRDDALMGLFLPALDRLIRRRVRRRATYDRQTRQSSIYEVLQTPIDSMPKVRDLINPQYAVVLAQSRRLFSYSTRHYLRRRAWRYFRHAGFARPREYVEIVAAALKGYSDADLARGENILDSWSLLHVCFGESGILEFNVRYARLKEGRALRELTAAPRFPKLWEDPAAASVLLDLVLSANSRLVRVWATQLLRRDHRESLRQVNAARLVTLFDHPDPEIQQLGAELLEGVGGLETLPLETWLALLNVKNPTAQMIVVELMRRHVAPERVDLSLAVRLATAEATPIARLGVSYLAGRSIQTADEIELVAGLSAAHCAAVGTELARWTLERIGTPKNYDADRVARFFDSLLREMREAAWDWLTPESAGYNDALLWSRLLETPYDDVRMRFVGVLDRRGAAPGRQPRPFRSCGVRSCSAFIAADARS